MKIPGSITNGSSARSNPASTPKRIRSMIVDDHRLVREGLRAILEKDSRISVVGDAGNGREAVSLVRELKPDVILMDIFMPVLNGIDATHQLSENRAEPKVIGLSYTSRRSFIIEIIKAGAFGYLNKDSGTEELIDAVGAVAGGKHYLSSLALDALVKGVMNGDVVSATLLPLTGRECEVLKLIAEGRSSQEAASILRISTKTLDTHRMAVMRKLNIFTIAGLTRFAVQRGLIPLEGD